METWEQWIMSGNWDLFVEDILANHYDTAYALAATRSGRDDEAADFLMLPNTEDETYAAAAAVLIEKWDVRVPPATEKETESEPRGEPAKV